MRIVRTGLIAAVAACVLLPIAGCQQKGPAEKAGEKAGEAVDGAGERAQDSLQRIQDSLEKAKENMEKNGKK